MIRHILRYSACCCSRPCNCLRPILAGRQPLLRRLEPVSLAAGDELAFCSGLTSDPSHQTLCQRSGRGHPSTRWPVRLPEVPFPSWRPVVRRFCYKANLVRRRSASAG